MCTHRARGEGQPRQFDTIRPPGDACSCFDCHKGAFASTLMDFQSHLSTGAAISFQSARSLWKVFLWLEVGAAWLGSQPGVLP